MENDLEEINDTIESLDNPEGFVLSEEERQDIINETLAYLDETDGAVRSVEGDVTIIETDGVDKAKELVDNSLQTTIDGNAGAILADFNFGTTDYAGAVKAGDVVWNQTTGVPTSGSGIVVYRGGIVGVKNAVKTFYIDTAGNAVFAGTLSAASGTFTGSLTAATGTFTGTLTTGAVTSSTITGSTITGNTIRTAASGRRVQMTTDQYIRWYDGTSLEGLIYTDSGGNMQIKGYDSVYVYCGTQTTDFIWLDANAGDMYLDSSTLYFTQTGDWQINQSDNIYMNFYDSGFNIYEDDGLAFRVDSGKDTWIADNCSADSFTDRTPYYEGDALEELSKVRGKTDEGGELQIDHTTLPAFTSKKLKVPKKGQKIKTKGKTEVEEVIEDGRDLGATISMLVVAVNQLNERTKSLAIKEK